MGFFSHSKIIFVSLASFSYQFSVLSMRYTAVKGPLKLLLTVLVEIVINIDFVSYLFEGTMLRNTDWNLNFINYIPRIRKASYRVVQDLDPLDCILICLFSLVWYLLPKLELLTLDIKYKFKIINLVNLNITKEEIKILP